jgi:hypothetical protein
MTCPHCTSTHAPPPAHALLVRHTSALPHAHTALHLFKCKSVSQCTNMHTHVPQSHPAPHTRATHPHRLKLPYRAWFAQFRFGIRDNARTLQLWPVDSLLSCYCFGWNSIYDHDQARRGNGPRVRGRHGIASKHQVASSVPSGSLDFYTPPPGSMVSPPTTLTRAQQWPPPRSAGDTCSPPAACATVTTAFYPTVSILSSSAVRMHVCMHAAMRCVQGWLGRATPFQHIFLCWVAYSLREADFVRPGISVEGPPFSTLVPRCSYPYIAFLKAVLTYPLKLSRKLGAAKCLLRLAVRATPSCNGRV